MQLDTVRKLKVEARARIERIEGLDGSAREWVSFGIRQRDEDDFGMSVRVRTPEKDLELEQAIRQALAPLVGPEDVDLQHTGPIFALRGHVGSDGSGTLTIGASISHYLTLGGSLGFFATSRLNGERGLVSANHVIGELDAAAPGDAIVHPAGADPRTNKIAEFVRSVPLGGGGEKIVDAAFARLTTNDFDPATLPDGRLRSQLAPPSQSPAVKKFGHRTQLTSGTVTDLDNDGFEILGYRNGFGVVHFDNLIEVESADPQKPFALEGDSGALAFDASFRPMALIFGGTLGGGRFGNGLTYMSPLSAVLDLLNVDLLT